MYRLVRFICIAAFVVPVLAVLLPAGTVSAAPLNVGYYDMSAGAGSAYQVGPIVTAGHTPINVDVPDAATLAGLNVLFVDNPDNNGYGAEYLANAAAIAAAVNNGMVLIIQDWYVTGCTAVLPGGGGVTCVRDFTDEANIDIVDNSTAVTVGLDNSSLDGGTSSNHGYAVAGSLPGGARNILSRALPAESVLFSYPYGAGSVIYGTVPLGFYLDGSGPNPPRDNFANIYAPNLIRYAAALSSVVPAGVPGPDMVTIPEGAVVGLILTDTPAYWAPNAGAATGIMLQAGKTFWVYGVDESRAFYKAMMSGQFFWVTVGLMGPNPDEVWNNTPLPTNVVE